jgi:c-di-GMP-binding flagellar brake protein YcgR
VWQTEKSIKREEISGMGNRRRHKRVPFASIVALRFKDDEEDRLVETLTADISMSGIGLYASGAVEVDKDVAIEIFFIGADGLIRTDHIEGHTVYVKKIEKINFVGIEFDEEINANRQTFLFERLERILQWE